MIHVFVETNFLLNISFKQEEHRSSYQLLKLSEERKIKLCVPAFCVSEAYWGASKKNETQIETKGKVNNLINDALRNSYSRRSFEKYRQIPIDIDKKLDKELKMLDRNIARFLRIAKLIEHNTIIHRNGIAYRSRLDIKHEPDAFIISAIVWHKTNKMPSTSQDLFVTVDSKLAIEPKVKQLMQQNGIMLESSFKESIETLKSRGVRFN